MKRALTHLFFFSLGSAAGFVTGIMLAPEEGQTTRDKASFRLSKLREQLRQLINDLVEQEKDPMSTAKTEGQKVIRQTKEQAEKLLTDVDTLIGQIKEEEQHSPENSGNDQPGNSSETNNNSQNS